MVKVTTVKLPITTLKVTVTDTVTATTVQHSIKVTFTHAVKVAVKDADTNTDKNSFTVKVTPSRLRHSTRSQTRSRIRTTTRSQTRSPDEDKDAVTNAVTVSHGQGNSHSHRPGRRQMSDRHRHRQTAALYDNGAITYSINSNSRTRKQDKKGSVCALLLLLLLNCDKKTLNSHTGGGDRFVNPSRTAVLFWGQIT